MISNKARNRAWSQTDKHNYLLPLRFTILSILLITQMGCSRISELTHSVTNSISNTVSGGSSKKKSAPSVTVTTSYHDDEGEFDASLLESIKPKVTTDDWMYKHFGRAASTKKIENDLVLLNWPFIVEIKKSKKSYIFFKSSDSTKKPMFLHAVVDNNRVGAVWVNDRAEPNEDEALKALEHPQRLVMNDSSKTSTVAAKPTKPVVIPDSPVVVESEKPRETAATPVEEKPATESVSAETRPKETAPTEKQDASSATTTSAGNTTSIPETATQTNTAPATMEKHSSDTIKIETKEPIPAKSAAESADEKVEEDISKEVGNLKSN